MVTYTQMRNYAIPIIFILMVLFPAVMGYEQQVSRFWIFGSVVIMALAFSGFAEMWFKYNSPQIVSHMRSWSFNPKDVVKIEGWSIYSLGGISKYFDFHGTEGTIFTLSDYSENVGSNVMILARLEQVSPLELDPRWKQLIPILKLSEPYYFAGDPLDPDTEPHELKRIIQLKKKENLEKVTFLTEELKKKNEYINTSDTIMKRAYKLIEDTDSWERRLKKKESLLEKLGREPKQDD